MNINIPSIRVVCGNAKCRHSTDDPVLEFNFYTSEVVFVCPKCGQDSKITLKQEAKPLPRIKAGRL